MRRAGIALGLLIICFCALRADALEGVYTGCWTDYDGNNYCGEPPSSGSSSYYDSGGYSYDSSSYYSSAAASALGEALGSLLVQALSGMAAAQATSSQAFSFNSQASTALSAGDYEQAISLYQQALEYAPGDYIIQNNLRRAQVAMYNDQALALHKQGDWEGALAAYEQALVYDPSNRVIHQNIRLVKQKQAYENIRQREEALKVQMAEASSTLRAKADELARGLKPTPSEAAASVPDLKRLPESRYGPHKGLHIKTDIPLPGEAPPLPSASTDEGSAKISPYLAKANEMLDDATTGFWEGKIWLREKMTDWGAGELVDKAVEYIPLADKVQGMMDFYDDTKELYEKVGGQHEATAQGALDLFRSSVYEAANPNQRTTGPEIDEWLQSRGETYKKMGHEAYMEKFKGSSEEMLEGFQGEWDDYENEAQEEDEVMPLESKPILGLRLLGLKGLKSYDRQRQEYLDKNR